MSMKLASDFVFDPEIQTPKAPAFRVAAAAPETEDPLGPLAELKGTWKGTGFNTIWRPFHDPGNPRQDRFLELNRTEETLHIEEIKGAIPNRGLLQPDIDMFGVHYLQQIKDANTGEALHFEPGIWLNIPGTTDPDVPRTVARLGSIPHGTSILLQGTGAPAPQPPRFDVADITPFVIGDPSQKVSFPESDLSRPTPFRTPDLTGITQAMVNDPNSVLQAAIAGQTIVRNTVLVVTSEPRPVPGGGTANTAFLEGAPGGRPNADGAQVTSTFWIETVKGGRGRRSFLQLQYTQTVLLDFAGLSWPHVTVATMRKVSRRV